MTKYFSANLFILREVFNFKLLEFYLIEFNQILPIYSPMYNKQIRNMSITMLICSKLQFQKGGIKLCIHNKTLRFIV